MEMSSPELLLQVLRSEMRAANMTYRGLAERLELSESSIKRMFSQGDMSLSRLALVCKVIGVALEDVLRQAADAAPQSDTLTLAQERALVADLRLLMVATCCLGHWTLEQIVETYAISEAECIGCLLKLDRLALIELKPLNRYRLRVSRAFRWLPDGPVQQLMRQHVVGDFFAGRFDGPGETMLCVHGRLSDPSAQELVQKIQQLAAELARLHQDDQRLQPALRDGYTLMLGLRSWEFSQFTAMRR
jgi:transcriptional regulator with XRE-family HTH domain